MPPRRSYPVAILAAIAVAAGSSLALASAPSTAGGIRLGTWVAHLGGKQLMTMELKRSGSGANEDAGLKLLRLTATCTFPKDQSNPSAPVPAPITVTWTYNHPNSLGPIGFLRSNQSGQGIDLDENQPGPMGLVIHFGSSRSATGKIGADETVHGSGTCITGGSASQYVHFTARWSHA